MKVTQARLKELVSWNGSRFVNLGTRKGRNKAGSLAGTPNPEGYYYMMVDGVNYRHSHLVWLWHHGEFPACQVDHINRNPSDDRIENLRLAPNNSADNSQNKGRYKNSTFGPGVRKRGDRFYAVLGVAKKRVIRSGFKTPEEASQAYQALKKEHHHFAISIM